MKQYSEMLEEAKNAGLTNEKIMWKSIAGVSEMLQLVKRDHPEMYWEFMREQHGILYGNHYNESFAIHDVSMIRYTDRMGKKCEGPYWTLEQIESATKGMAYPAGTTKWDKYVAFNGFTQIPARYWRKSKSSRQLTNFISWMKMHHKERFGCTWKQCTMRNKRITHQDMEEILHKIIPLAILTRVLLLFT